MDITRNPWLLPPKMLLMVGLPGADISLQKFTDFSAQGYGSDAKSKGKRCGGSQQTAKAVSPFFFQSLLNVLKGSSFARYFSNFQSLSYVAIHGKMM